MAQEFTPPPSLTPLEPKKNNTTLIIIIVVAVLLLCCCCIAIAGYLLWTNGDRWFGITSQVVNYLLLM